MNNLETAISILGSDNIERIREELTNLIIEDLKESVKYEWFVLPEEWNTMFEDTCKEVYESMKKKYKKELKDLAESKFKEWIAGQSSADKIKHEIIEHIKECDDCFYSVVDDTVYVDQHRLIEMLERIEL